MKLRTKLALSFAIVLFSFSALLIMFDNLLLDRFYISKKKSSLNMAYSEVQEYVNNSTELDENIYLREIGDIANTTSTTIQVFDVDGNNIDNRPNIPIKNLTFLKISIKTNDEDIILRNRIDYEKYITTDGLDIQFGNENEPLKNIAVVGRLVKNNETCGYVFIYTSYTSVKSNTGIFNAFTIYIASLLFVITLCVSYIISNSLTKPLKDVKDKASKMANLDFSTKLEVKSRDEVGELSISINKMSDELEKSIKQLKEANIKLENDIKLKERINQLREEFISDVSHELKTPISIISGYSEALKLEGLTQEDINEYADIIIDESKRMNKLVKDLLKFTQIESGFISLDKEDFEIKELINDIIKPNDLRLKEKQVKLEIEIDDVLVNGDFEMMETVFNNIFVNAINHVDYDRIIKVKGEVINGKYRISVYNTGDQISEDNQKRIFESFYKVDKSRSRQYGGSGLGLAIVKSIMSTYGNEFGTYNTEDGVIFFFDINLSENKEITGESHE